MNIIYQTIFYTILNSLGLLIFKNNSNFSDYIIIPIITSLLVKYFVGDWDEGYHWTISDIYCWTTMFGISLITIFLYKKYLNYKIII